MISELKFWWQSFLGMFKPGLPSAKWVGVSLLLLAINFIVLFVMIKQGTALYAVPNHYFGEGRIGTFLSLSYLLLGSAVCFAISRKLMSQSAIPSKWRGFFNGLMGLLVFYLVAMIFYWILGEQRHEKNFYYFRHGRAAWYVTWVVFILGVVLVIMLWRWMRSAKFARFWLGFGLLVYYTALDDMFKFHERNARYVAMEWLNLPREHWLTHDLNDWFIVSYGVIAMVLFLVYRKFLMQLPWLIWSLIAALICFVGTVIWDMTHWAAWVEETLKLSGGVLILIALLGAYWSKTLSNSVVEI